MQKRVKEKPGVLLFVVLLLIFLCGFIPVLAHEVDPLSNINPTNKLRTSSEDKEKGIKRGSLKITNIDGEKIVYGSVLDEDQNKLLIKLPRKLLSTIRKIGKEKIYITISQIAQVSGENVNSYFINPDDSVTVLRKTLEVDLFSNLTDANGLKFNAQSLKEGEYKLSIIVNEKIQEGEFEYKPPLAIAGNLTIGDVDCNGGIHSIVDLSGNTLSSSVSLSDCSYLNELSGDKLELIIDALVLKAGNKNLAVISKVLTNDGIFYAPVKLEKDGEARYKISPRTTRTVTDAVNLLKGEEDSFFLNVILRKEADKNTNLDEQDKITEQPTSEACKEKLSLLLSTVSDNPSKEELLVFGKKIISEFENVAFKNCFSEIVSEKIILYVEIKGDMSIIPFAENFILSSQKELSQGKEEKSKEICKDLNEQISDQSPCLPEELKLMCPEIKDKITDECQEGLRACDLEEEGDEDCVDISTIESSIRLCKFCELDEDCDLQESIENSNKCKTPEVACISTVNPDNKEVKVCHIKNGTLANPFTCEELPVLSAASQCLAVSAPQCKINPSGKPKDGFDKRCCPTLDSDSRVDVELVARLLFQSSELHCGNGVKEGQEQCDDGNHDEGDGCSEKCQSEICGNGIKNKNEDCDDGNNVNNDFCSNLCKEAKCGDSIVQPSKNEEECDDGNTNKGDGCSDNCKFEHTCGNGVKEGQEQCDDGNHNKGDGCDDKCRAEVCGNGIKDEKEECDDGNNVNNDFCSNLCKEAKCGDSIVQPSKNEEECDDGNTNKGDGCSDNCKFEHTCGNGIREGQEQCDDGNHNKGDGCDDKCLGEAIPLPTPKPSPTPLPFPSPKPSPSPVPVETPTPVPSEAVCGDKKIEGNEQCDDGNTDKGDGCDSNCKVESSPINTSFPGQPNIPIEACVFKILCSDIEANFSEGEFGKPQEGVIELAVQQCRNLLLGSGRPGSLPPVTPTNTSTYVGGTEPSHPSPEGGIDPEFCIFHPKNPICKNRTYDQSQTIEE